MVKNKGLGQGVGLLFGEEEQEKFFHCAVTNIVPNKYQPRSNFKEDSLEELADSIRENGIIQPLIVAQGEGDKYELVAGERRLRASKLAGLTEVPVVLLELDNDESLLELALIENIQRTDLNAIEEAEAYRKLIDRFGYTQEETAKRVGKQRSTITNLLRLLKLPEQIQTDITNGLLSEGHGRALVKLVDDPLKMNEIRDAIIKNGFSVRQAEKTIKKAVAVKPQIKNSKEQSNEQLPSSYIQAMTTQLTNRLNSKVTIHQSGTRGKIEVEYYSADDLDRLTSMLLDD